MRYYETLYLINPNLADEEYRDVITKFNGLIEKNKGVIIKVDEWGKKALAYRVRKFDKGSYVLLQFCGEPGITAELRRDFGLDDRVLKYQTVKLSNNVDPEALKAKATEGETEAGEKTEGTPDLSLEPEAETENYQEGENGVQ